MAKDSRQERDILARLLIAGLGAVVADYFLGPIIKGKLGVK